MTILFIKIAGTDRSAKGKGAEINLSANEAIGEFLVILDNTGNPFGIGVQNIVEIRLTDAAGPYLVGGYVDVPKQLLEDYRTERLRVIGRDYGQDLMNLTINKVYPKQPISDIVSNMLTTKSSELTISIEGATPGQAPYEGKDTYLIDAVRDLCETVYHDWRIDNLNKKLVFMARGSQSSGITLKSVEDAEDNNLLEFLFDAEDGLSIRNRIIARGKQVTDGWTNGNASDWVKETGNEDPENDTVKLKVGSSSIKVRCLSLQDKTGLSLSFPKYSRDYLDWSIYEEATIEVWAHYLSNLTTSLWNLHLELTDINNNVILYAKNKDMLYEAWSLHSFKIGTKTTSKQWAFIVGSTFNWKIKKIRFYTIKKTIPDNFVIRLILDGLTLPDYMLSVREDSGAGSSQEKYRVREYPFSATDLETQLELDQLAESKLAMLKDPIAHIRCLADGDAGIISGVNKWIPGYTVVVNAPGEGINNQTYRMMNIKMLIYPHTDVHSGHDFVVELGLAKVDALLDTKLWESVHQPDFFFYRPTSERLNRLERKEISRRISGLFPLPDPGTIKNEHIAMDAEIDLAKAEAYSLKQAKVHTSVCVKERRSVHFDGDEYSTSYVQPQLLKTKTYPADIEIRQYLFHVRCKICVENAGATAYAKVTYQMGAGAETLLVQWTETETWHIQKTYDCDIKTAKNEQLIIKWYLWRSGGTGLVYLRDAEERTQGVNYTQEVEL